MIARHWSASCKPSWVMPRARSVVAISATAAASLRRRLGEVSPDSVSCCCRSRARSRILRTRSTGMPVRSRNSCASSNTSVLAVPVAAVSAFSARSRWTVATCHLPAGEDGEHEQRRRRRPGQAQRAALLAHFLREQVLLRDAADGGREVGAELGELGVAWRGAVAVGGEIDPFRLGREGALEHRWQRRCRRPAEIARRIVPGQHAVGERDQQRVGALVLEPVGDLLADPRRRRRLRRSEQDQKARLAERLLDRGPQLRGRRQRGVVAEHAQRPALVPGLAEALHHRLAAPPRSACPWHGCTR